MMNDERRDRCGSLMPSRDVAPPVPGAPVLDRRLARSEVATRGDARVDAVVESLDGDAVVVRVGGERIALRWVQAGDACGFELPSGRFVAASVGPHARATEVLVAGNSLFVGPARVLSRQARDGTSMSSEVRARMDGRVVQVLVAVGDRVNEGQSLLVVEAMKMEDTVRAQRGGTVREVRVAAGGRVRRDETLLVLDPGGDSR